MIVLIPALLGGVLATLAGAIILVLTSDSDESTKIDLPEFIGGSILCLIICFSTFAIGNNMAKSSKLEGYKQFINGNVMVAKVDRIPCDRDGSCQNTYQCDSYQVTIDDSYTDSKGNVHHSSHQETRYHDCPYTTEEFDYWVLVDFGYRKQRYDVYSGAFSTQPQEWRQGGGLPGNILRGEPVKWTEAKISIEIGSPLGATTVDKYTNYILAADDSLLKRYSPDIEKYRKDKLLPEHTDNWKTDPISGWDAVKFHAVGGAKVDSAKWNKALQQFNGGLGVTRQGNLHMVVIPSSKISNSESYINSLVAYWQSERYDKWSIAKNSIVIVVGISDDGTTVNWVREKTGMSIGNGQMQAALESIKDVPFDIDTFLGQPKAKYVKSKLTYTNSKGIVENIVIFDKTTMFLRPCMDCKDKGDHGSSYTYLKTEVKIPTSVLIWQMIISFVLCAGVWIFLFFYPVVSNFRNNFYSRY